MNADRKNRHALVVGGTGMLRAASIAIANRSYEITSVARTRRSLSALDSAIPPETTHHALSLDWSDPEAFLRAIEHHLSDTAPPDLVVAWVHDDELTLRLAPLVGSDRPRRFFHVIGSGGKDPSIVARSLREEFEAPPNVSYHQVILGFERSSGRSRWLTNDEISAGVLEAIERERTQFVVGTVEPWSARP